MGVAIRNRCLDREKFFPPEEPKWCHRNDVSGICCDTDMCNEKLIPPLVTAGNRVPPKSKYSIELT